MMKMVTGMAVRSSPSQGKSLKPCRPRPVRMPFTRPADGSKIRPHIRPITMAGMV